METVIANLSTKHGILQCPLDLQFDVGSQVAFYTSGASTSVHLSGYVVLDEEDLSDEEEEEEEEMDGSEDEGIFTREFYLVFSCVTSFRFSTLFLLLFLFKFTLCAVHVNA